MGSILMTNCTCDVGASAGSAGGVEEKERGCSDARQNLHQQNICKGIGRNLSSLCSNQSLPDFGGMDTCSVRMQMSGCPLLSTYRDLAVDGQRSKGRSNKTWM